MAKAEASVEELVGMIERGEIRLPEMQRRYVWQSTRVRDLLDSLYRGYPSGAILLWQTDEKVHLQDFAVHQAANPYRDTKLLLDGQQRLTSLSAIIRGTPIHVAGRTRPIEILFNLEHPDSLEIITEVDDNSDIDATLDTDEEENIDELVDSTENELQQRVNRMTFVVATNKLAQDPRWVNVTEVFQTDNINPFLERAGVTNLRDPRAEKYQLRLAKLKNIRKYIYRMDILERTLSYEEVTEIFVRVNSLGAKLRSSDLALAQITAKWRGSLEIFQKYQHAWKLKGYDLELGIILKALTVFGTGQSRFRTVGALSLIDLQHAWDKTISAFDYALNFLKENVKIDSPVLLSSPNIIITLAYYAHTHKQMISSDTSNLLKRWTLIANAKGRYSRGSTESYLDQDIAVIRDGGSINDLLERLKAQVGRLDFQPEELVGRNQRSAIFKTMFLAFRDSGAKDWQSGLLISFDHSGSSHQLQIHHIFPKARLRAQAINSGIDDIANLAFIGGKANREISASDPAVYLPAIIAKSGPSAVTHQCIPSDPALLVASQYDNFLRERRKLICQRVNEFLDVSP